jgi:hypothetical protein
VRGWRNGTLNYYLGSVDYLVWGNSNGIERMDYTKIMGVVTTKYHFTPVPITGLFLFTLTPRPPGAQFRDRSLVVQLVNQAIDFEIITENSTNIKPAILTA